MSVKKLIVWQKAMDLVVLVYEKSSQLPQSEVFGLQSQMRRATVSVAANIAEGYGRSNTGDYIRFLDISLGSLRELETHFEICKRLNYIESQELEDSIDQVGKLLFSTRRTLKGNFVNK